MEKNDEIRKELQDIAPRLNGLPRKDPFQVPTDYFEGLPARVQDRISKSRPADAVPLLDWLTRYRWAPAFASVLVALIFCVALYLSRGEGTGDMTAQVQKPAPETTVQQPEIKVSADELADVLSDEDVEELIASADIPEAKMKTEKVRREERKPAKSAESAELKEYILDNFDEYTLTETL